MSAQDNWPNRCSCSKVYVRMERREGYGSGVFCIRCAVYGGKGNTSAHMTTHAYSSLTGASAQGLCDTMCCCSSCSVRAAATRPARNRESCRILPRGGDCMECYRRGTDRDAPLRYNCLQYRPSGQWSSVCFLCTFLPLSTYALRVIPLAHG